jgi:uncharacterized membrane protein YheB (UPF0754 family)
MPIEVSSQYLSLAAPPVLGAFIGYLTNKVAIRMLFRPLKTWRILGLRVPMTPGVIPAKRHSLAVNIGNMVGEQLLTSRDIGEALSREPFQLHLRTVIDSRAGDLLVRDLGSMESIVPESFQAYFAAGVKVVQHKLREGVQDYIGSTAFEEALHNYLNDTYRILGERQVDDVVGLDERSAVYETLDRLIQQILGSEQAEQWLADYIEQSLQESADKGKTLGDLLPEVFIALIREMVGRYAPVLLQQLASLLSEEPVREKIIKAVRGGIDEFIASLGPLGAMAGNFMDMDMLESKIREYLSDKEEEIGQWLQNDAVQHRFRAVLLEQIAKLFEKPLAELLVQFPKERKQQFYRESARQLFGALRSQGVSRAVSDMLRANMESWLESGERSLADVLNEIFTTERKEALGQNVAEEMAAMLRTRRAARFLGTISDTMVAATLQRPIGPLANLLPQGVREGITDTVVMAANRMLLKEVPGLVDSLNIRRIVTEKVDSLDLLQVEELLLSIMKEQFKYINLFGALLGFIIGLVNLLLIGLQ